jgi:stage II sporulation protein AA (anti-sigma F factor antagonist)
MALELTTDTVDDVLIVYLRGRLEAATAEEADESLMQLIDAGQHRLALDLSRLDYASSAGLRTIVSTAKHLKSVQGALVLYGLRPSIKNLFAFSGLSAMITIVETQTNALDALSHRT